MSGNRLLALFDDPRTPILLDGGWGTELQRRGLALGQGSDAWNLSHPDEVIAVAKAYIAAGSRAILTNTFQANRLALDRQGLADQVGRINEAGARIAREAVAGSKVRVIGSIGPIGASADVAARAFAEQAEALAEGGVDALVVETGLGLDEARVAVRAALATGLPVAATFHFQAGDAGPVALDGSTPAEVAHAMVEAGADTVGANCGGGIADFPEVCKLLASTCDLPIWIKPNAGLPTIEGGRADYPEGPATFAASLPDLLRAGARFVGGCCGTDPRFIRALRLELNRTSHAG